jgi:hypothetical protein
MIFSCLSAQIVKMEIEEQRSKQLPVLLVPLIFLIMRIV